MLLQLYSLGVPHPDTGVLAVHVVASDTEMDQVDDHKAMDDDACRRVAEVLMFATALNHLKATNQVHSHSSVLHVWLPAAYAAVRALHRLDLLEVSSVVHTV